MNYPLISKYYDAIKLAEDYRNQLAHLRPVRYEDDILVISTGNFA